MLLLQDLVIRPHHHMWLSWQNYVTLPPCKYVYKSKFTLTRMYVIAVHVCIHMYHAFNVLSAFVQYVCTHVHTYVHTRMYVHDVYIHIYIPYTFTYIVTVFIHTNTRLIQTQGLYKFWSPNKHQGTQYCNANKCPPYLNARGILINNSKAEPILHIWSGKYPATYPSLAI